MARNRRQRIRELFVANFAISLALVFLAPAMVGIYFLWSADRRFDHAVEQLRLQDTRIRDLTDGLEQRRVELTKATRTADIRICVGQNDIRRQIRGSLDRTKADLRRLAYYREHPGEYRDALRRIEREKTAFSDIMCSDLPTVVPGGS